MGNVVRDRLFDFRARGMDLEAITLVHHLADVFEPVSLQLVGLGRRISIVPGKFCECNAVTSSTGPSCPSSLGRHGTVCYFAIRS